LKKREEGLQSEIAEMKVKIQEREVKLYEEISTVCLFFFAHLIFIFVIADAVAEDVAASL
jgi:hypothetical protein